MFLDVLKGHENVITALEFVDFDDHNRNYTDNSRVWLLLLSGSQDRTIKLWDVDEGVLLQSLPAHHDVVWHIAVKDDTHILTSSQDRTIKLWRIDIHPHRDNNENNDNNDDNDGIPCLVMQREITRNTAFSAAPAVCWHPSGSYFVSGHTDNAIRIWTYPACEVVMTFEGIWCGGHSDTITTLAISPNGKHLISGSEDKTVKIWKFPDFSSTTTTATTTASSLLKTLDDHDESVTSVAISPEGKLFATSSYDDTIKL